MAFGAAKTKKRNVGMAWSIDLIKITLLGKLRDRRVQLESLCFSLSKNSCQSAFFGLSRPMGMPRYLVGRFPLENPRTLNMHLWVTGGY